MHKKLLSVCIALVVLVTGCGTTNKINKQSQENNAQYSEDKKEDVAYSWKVKPTIEADNILVWDGKDYGVKERCDLAVIEKDNKYGLIDYKGSILVECSYDGYLICSCGMIYVQDSKSNALITVDNENNILKGAHSDHGMLQEPGMEDETLSGYENCILLNENIYAVKKNGKWGYRNKNNEEILSCKFMANSSEGTDNVPAFSGNLVTVKNENGAGYYDKNGKCVIQCGEFEEARSTQNGKAWVKKNGKWGVIEINKFENTEGYKYAHLQSQYTDNVLFQDYLNKQEYPERISSSNLKELGQCVFICNYQGKLTFMDVKTQSVANKLNDISFWKINDKDEAEYSLLTEDYRIHTVAWTNWYRDKDDDKTIYFELYHYAGSPDGGNTTEKIGTYHNDSGLINFAMKFDSNGLGGGNSDLSLIPVSEIDWNSLELQENDKNRNAQYYTFNFKHKYSYSIEKEIVKLGFDHYN